MCPSFLIKAGKRVILIIFIFFDTHSHCQLSARICDFVTASNEPYIILSAHSLIRIVIRSHTRYYPNCLVLFFPVNSAIQHICYITKFKVVVTKLPERELRQELEMPMKKRLFSFHRHLPSTHLRPMCNQNSLTYQSNLLTRHT